MIMECDWTWGTSTYPLEIEWVILLIMQRVNITMTK